MAGPGKPKTGGRQKGTVNKTTADLFKICEEEGIDPFRAMVKETQLMSDSKERFDALEKICQYLHPKRKALELSNEDEALPFRVIIEDYGKK